MAEAMFEWLRTQVPAKNDELAGFKGYELLGMLHPDNPNPADFKEPPKWLSPELLMKGTCAWYAGAVQGFLFSSGLAPIVRAQVDDGGNLVSLAAADLEVDVSNTSIRVAALDGSAVLDDASSIQITPIGTGIAGVGVTPVKEGSSVVGWDFVVTNLTTDPMGAYIHVYR